MGQECRGCCGKGLSFGGRRGGRQDRIFLSCSPTKTLSFQLLSPCEKGGQHAFCQLDDEWGPKVAGSGQSGMWGAQGRSQGNPLFQCAFPCLKVLSVQGSQYSPLGELSVPEADQAWDVGSSPTPAIPYASPQTFTQESESPRNVSLANANK